MKPWIINATQQLVIDFSFIILRIVKLWGGDQSFDVYNASYSDYISHNQGSVFVWNVKGRWADDAPIGGFSSMDMRGYVRGNYLAPHYTHVQVEDRIAFAPNWGVSVFGGLGCLYDAASDCNETSNLYLSFGAGIIYTLKKKAGLVLRAEVAKGETT